MKDFKSCDSIIYNQSIWKKITLGFINGWIHHLLQTVCQNLRYYLLKCIAKAYRPIMSHHNWIFIFGTRDIWVWLINEISRPSFRTFRVKNTTSSPTVCQFFWKKQASMASRSGVRGCMCLRARSTSALVKGTLSKWISFSLRVLVVRISSVNYSCAWDWKFCEK